MQLPRLACCCVLFHVVALACRPAQPIYAPSDESERTASVEQRRHRLSSEVYYTAFTCSCYSGCLSQSSSVLFGWRGRGLPSQRDLSPSSLHDPISRNNRGARGQRGAGQQEEQSGSGSDSGATVDGSSSSSIYKLCALHFTSPVLVVREQPSIHRHRTTSHHTHTQHTQRQEALYLHPLHLHHHYHYTRIGCYGTGGTLRFARRGVHLLKLAASRVVRFRRDTTLDV